MFSVALWSLTRKLQLALEQEEKEGLLNKNNENLTDINSAPVKQKKEDPKFDEINVEKL